MGCIVRMRLDMETVEKDPTIHAPDPSPEGHEVGNGRTRGGPSRRDVLKWGAMGSAALAASRFSFGQQRQDFPVGDYGSTPRVLSSPKLPGSTYAICDRITFGTTTAEMALKDKLGWSAYVEYHLAPEKIDDSVCDSRLQEYSSIYGTPFELLKTFTWNNGYDHFWELSQSQLIRAVYSKRQLLEVMTEFWLDHFNVNIDQTWSQLLSQYVRTIRANALGNFSTLLTAVVKSGAMLVYLDNDKNDRGFHNENFARELLELHTLGVYNGYTENDIYVCRRCFTGWNVEEYYTNNWEKNTNPNWGQFKYYTEHHDPEGGVFMGAQVSPGGAKGQIEQGEAILAKVSTHKNTAYRLASKLCTKFLGEGVSASFIQKVADAFITSKMDIKSALRVILNETNFKANIKPKFKRPFHFLVSAVRCSYGNIADAGDILGWYVAPMKQQPFRWPAPNGYPDAYAAWSDNLLPRWRFASTYAFNNIWGARMDPFSYITARTRDGVVNYINRYYFANTLSATAQAQLKAYMPATNPNNQSIRETIGLAMSLPDFQWC